MVKTTTILLCGLLLGVAMAQESNSSDEPLHAAAIRLVMEAKKVQISRVDSPGDWENDTKKRSWAAQRPFEPGFIDSTNWFQVTYEVDGRVLGSWNVNTKTGQVADQGEEFHID